MDIEYNKEYFIAKFEAIPEEKWITDKLTDDCDKESHCAFGHCGMRVFGNYTYESLGLKDLFATKKTSVIAVNDDDNQEKYKGNTPKERILNFLKSI